MWATHQYIEEQAYTTVTNDPAFKNGDLPTLGELQAVAGNAVGYVTVITTVNSVFVTNVEVQASGVGPDAEKQSNYSEHWYNPVNGEGGAPESIKGHIFKWHTSNTTKDVDWAAHYLADMSTPVHMFGMMRSNILAKLNAARANKTSTNLVITLDSDVTGPAGQQGRNWAFEVLAFEERSKHDWVDFFDPWYYDTNGIAMIPGIMTNQVNTHAGWEFTVPKHTTKWDKKYSSEWQNPNTLSFKDYPTNSSLSASNFAKKTAATTRNEYKNEITNPQPPIDRAIATVATMWRASFSALHPLIEDAVDSGDADNRDNYDITAMITNTAASEATGVELQISLDGATIVKGELTRKLGNITGNGCSKPDDAKWTIKTDNPKNCKITIETIGGFKIPDLQYRTTTFRMQTYEVTNSFVFVIDATGSMAGPKLETAKAMAIEEINKLKEDSEAAVISFSGCENGLTFVSRFKLMDIKGRAAVCAAVKGIGPGDNTNIAEATTKAGNYARNKGRGKIRRALIILTDGVETCNGDPAAAVKEVNDVKRIETEIK